MFSQAWNIYLPIIKILLKRSAGADQTLDMNRTDFERAAGGRKAKLTFSISFIKAAYSIILLHHHRWQENWLLYCRRMK